MTAAWTGSFIIVTPGLSARTQGARLAATVATARCRRCQQRDDFRVGEAVAPGPETSGAPRKRRLAAATARRVELPSPRRRRSVRCARAGAAARAAAGQRRDLGRHLAAAELLLHRLQPLAERHEIDAGLARLREDRALLLLDVVLHVLGEDGDARL